MARQLAADDSALSAIVARWRATPPARFFTLARGSSDHAAIYAQYLFGAFQRLAVSLKEA